MEGLYFYYSLSVCQNFPKMCTILNNWTYLGCYFIYRLHIWYNLIRHIQWSKCRWSWPLVKVKLSKKEIKNLRTSPILDAISPQTSSHLLSQLFVTNLGVVLLLVWNYLGTKSIHRTHISPRLWPLTMLQSFICKF